MGKINMKLGLLVGLSLVLMINSVQAAVDAGFKNLPGFTLEPLTRREPKLSASAVETLKQVRKLVEENRFNDAIAELKIGMSKKKDPALLLSIAFLYQQQQRDDLAIEALREAIKLLPDFVRAHRALGWLLTRKQQFTQARGHLQKVLLFSADADSYGMLAYGFMQQKQYLSARTAYQQAMLLDAEGDKWRQGLLQASLELKDHATVLALLEPMLEASPANATLWQIRASIYQQKSQWLSAITSLEMAYQLSPVNEHRWSLVQLYLQQSLFADAKPHLLEMFALPVKPEPEKILSVLHYLNDLNQPQLVHQLTDLLLEDDAISAELKSQYLALSGDAFMLQEKEQQARGKYKRSLQHNSLNGAALIALAQLITDQNPQKAERLLAQAGQLAEYRVTALVLRAQILINRKAYHRALGLLNQAYQLEPNRQSLRKNIETVERIIKAG